MNNSVKKINNGTPVSITIIIKKKNMILECDISIFDGDFSPS